ncbi:MAG TPA: ParB N-terminal domain-containing protein [Phycisphaerae bacterium]|nr:ParB N-terminal domain-containing protein [Phycisphaerae bacterium]
MKIADIRIEGRHRKDLGDLRPLADSIAAVGLLQPIVVTEDLRLVAGMRRIEAIKLLGKDGIKAIQVKNLTDAEKLLRAERDENTCRKDLSPSEAVALGKALESLAKVEAKERQREHGGTAPGRPKNTPGNLPEVSGEAREQVAAAVGMKPRTYDKAKAVVKAAEADPSLAPVVEEMDRTGKVDPAYKKVKKRKKWGGIAKDAPKLIRGHSPAPPPTMTLTLPTDDPAKAALGLLVVFEADFLRAVVKELVKELEGAD